jgi:hypothetical protein
MTEFVRKVSVVTDKTLSGKALSDPGKSPVYLLYYCKSTTDANTTVRCSHRPCVPPSVIQITVYLLF